jgi:hypothetical protein
MWLGVGTLVFATIEHRRQMRALCSEHLEYGRNERSPATVVAWVVSGLGSLMFLLAVFHQ